MHVLVSFFFLKFLFSSQISVDKFHWPVFKLIIFSVSSSLLIHPSWYLYFCYHNFSISIGLLLIASVFLWCSPLVHTFFMLFSITSAKNIFPLKQKSSSDPSNICKISESSSSKYFNLLTMDQVVSPLPCLGSFLKNEY